MANERRPTVGIISTGTEILQGLYPDTNAQWLSERLLAVGLPASGHFAVGDSVDDLENLLRQLLQQCDLLIVTGGLGPTVDDVNRFAIAHVYELELIEDESAISYMRDRFARRGLPFNDANRVQALMPQGAMVFYNDWGTAPGFLIEGKSDMPTLVALPGPPREMRPMFERSVEPYLIERYRPSERFLVLTIHTIDLPEVEINAKLDDLFGADPAVYIGLLAEHGKVDIRLTARGAGEQQLRERLEWFRKQIEGRIGTENIYGINDETLESAVGRLLKSRQLTIAVAESCTGGMIASRLTNMAGASSYLIEGFVTYSNNAKIERLGVSAELIERHGAVSRQVAQAMAESVRRLARADIGLSATGIAGPTGGTPEKAVGLVYVGLAWEGGSIAVERRFLGARNENRTYTTNAALDLLRRRLLRQTSASSDFGELSRAAKPSTQ